MPDVNKEYADLFEKYGYLWADIFNTVQGRGWNLLPNKPRSMLERNRIFVDLANKGYAVHTEEKYGYYYIYVLKLPESGGRVSESETEKLSRFSQISVEFTHLYGIYADKWAEDYRRDRGIGWQQLSGMAETEEEYRVIFVDYAKKGYKVYGRHPYGPAGYLHYIIYVKKLPESELPAVTTEKTGMRPSEHVVHIDEIKKIIRGYRLGYTDAATAIEDINEVVERM